MISFFIDVIFIWALISAYSDKNWEDKKFQVVGIVLLITVLGGLLSNLTVEYVGPYVALGFYFLIGTVCLATLASLPPKKAMTAMAIFTTYKVLAGIAFAFLFSVVDVS